MSFSGFGNNTGFGANNQQQQTTGFGFGASNTTTPGFGATGNTGFGGGNNANTTGGSLFGGGAAPTTGFGSPSGFGSNTQATTAFGTRPAFGTPATSSAGGLFGNTSTTANPGGFGGFGTTTANTGASGFGQAPSNGIFGQPAQTGFGSSPVNATNAFGGANAIPTGFGNTAQTGFGLQSGTAFGLNAQLQNQGTGGTPFQAHTEKDSSSNQNSTYQSITFQQPYTNFSFEELRLADYNQGRKYGNQNGQAGAFGANTGFGGFGNQPSNPGFGASPGNSAFGTNAAGGFGAAQPNTGFGSTTPAGAGLFGQPKTTPTSLFGTAANNTTSGTSLFGNPSGGFGQTPGAGTSPSLFGSQPQQKSIFGTTPTGAGFGTGGTTAFGQPQTATSTSNVFGQSPNASTPFGLGQQQPAAQTSSPFSGFGSPQNQTQSQNQTGGGLFGGGGAFGNNQQNQAKPLFPSNNSTSPFGLGQTQQQSPLSGGIFGTTPLQQNASLFAPKPATNTPSLFNSNSNNNAPPGTSLFSNLTNNQGQQNQGTGLFTQLQNQPKSSFSQANGVSTTGNGLFPTFGQNSANQQNAVPSLFGAPQNQQTQLNANPFGTPQQMQPQPQQAQQLTTSIMATNPYGHEHLFANLGTSSQAVGPLATPLSGSQRARKPAPLPQYLINPAASARMITPQKRTGFGFSYSTYGTPGSAVSTPNGYGSSLLNNGNFGRSLSKSLSTSNLRGTTPDDSILNLSAFSANGRRTYGSSGAMRKLHIDRSIRNDLWGGNGASEVSGPNPPRKTVSFEGSSSNNNTAGSTSNALVRVDESSKDQTENNHKRDNTNIDSGTGATLTAEEQGFLRSSNTAGNRPRSGRTTSSEVEQVNGKELAIVPEDSATASEQTGPSKAIPTDTVRLSQSDQVVGEYWMTPSKEELKRLDRKEKSKFKGFVVGRNGCGKIEFGEVDLNAVDIDKICGDIVRLEIRSATVYQDHAYKPPAGKGLNVPSLVTLENSWPRAKGGRLPVYERKGPRFEKHLERLRRVGGTEFVEYRVETGQWIFRVPHFSTYTFHYDDNDTSILSAPPDTPTSERLTAGQGRSRASQLGDEDTSMVSNTSSAQNSHPDDTFEFRKKRALPGAFEDDQLFSDVDMRTKGGFDPRRSTEGSSTTRSEIEAGSGNNSESSVSHNSPSAGSISNMDGTIDLDIRKYAPISNASAKPKSILKASQQHRPSFGSPARTKLAMNEDWIGELQRTLSPKKQDRQALRDTQGAKFRESPQRSLTTSIFANTQPAFATSIDVMNSLFGDGLEKKFGNARKQGVDSKGFQWPYAKRRKSNDDGSNMHDFQKTFHDLLKPSWATDGTLLYGAAAATTTLKSGILVNVKDSVISEGNDVRFAEFTDSVKQRSSALLGKQREVTSISVRGGVPYAITGSGFNFDLFVPLIKASDPASKHERTMWQLAAALFDEVVPGRALIIQEMKRKEKFSAFWRNVVEPAATEHSKNAISAEEKAIAFLSGYDIWHATEVLLKGKDYRLGTIIAQLGGEQKMREDMALQINDWRRTNVLSELSPPIRTLYEIVAGNTCISEGKKAVGAENRARDINISSEFNLDWRRAFGLKFWYGIATYEEIFDAVDSFSEDLMMHKEKVDPVPWFIEQKVSTGWRSGRPDELQDILWGLLKIHSAWAKRVKDGPVTDRALKLGDILSAESLAGNPMDARLAFQLYNLLSARDIVDFPEDERQHKADLLVNDFVFQLSHCNATLCDAVFVCLHMSRPESRKATVQALLERHAGAIGDSRHTCNTFRMLVDELMIPEAWIAAAKALHAKAVLHDDVAEVQWLLRGREWQQAHEALSRHVAPRCVIEEELPTLRGLLDAFEEGSATAGYGWDLQKGVYADFVRVVDTGTAGEERVNLARKLVGRLQSMFAMGAGLEERVAVHEMSRVVASVLADLRGKEHTMVDMLENRNSVLREAESLSEDYYTRVYAD